MLLVRPPLMTRYKGIGPLDRYKKTPCLDLGYWDQVPLEKVLEVVSTSECLVTGPPT